MVIYLVGKGFAFSPERDRQQDVSKAEQPRKKKSTERSRGRNGRKERKIYHSCRSPRWHRLSLPLSLTAVIEVKVWPQTERGREEKRITCQYLFPLAAWVETDTLHSLRLFFPLKPIQELYLCLGSRGLQGSPGRKQTWQDSEPRKGVSGRERGRRGWLTLTNNDFRATEWEYASEWTFPIASLWNTNNESNHCPGRLLLHLIDYRLYHQWEQLWLLSHRLSLTRKLHWL